MSKMTYDEVYREIRKFYRGRKWDWRDLNKDFVDIYVKIGSENGSTLKAIFDDESNAAPVKTYDEVYDMIADFFAPNPWGYYDICYYWQQLLHLIGPTNEDKLRELRANMGKRDGIA